MPDAAGRQGLKPLSATCPCYRCRLLLGFAYADRDSKDGNVSARRSSIHRLQAEYQA